MNFPSLVVCSVLFTSLVVNMVPSERVISGIETRMACPYFLFKDNVILSHYYMSRVLELPFPNFEPKK